MVLFTVKCPCHYTGALGPTQTTGWAPPAGLINTSSSSNLVFPGGLPSRYWPGSTLLSFSGQPVLIWIYFDKVKMTHTHVWSAILVGTLHRRNGFYSVQTVFSIALHLNLPLTGNFYFLKKKNSFCMIFKLLYPWHESPWVCVYSGLSPHQDI